MGGVSRTSGAISRGSSGARDGPKTDARIKRRMIINPKEDNGLWIEMAQKPFHRPNYSSLI